MWTDFWSLDPEYLDEEPYSWIAAILCTILSVFTIWGLVRGLRQNTFAAMPYLLVLLFYPLVYYLTHTADWYRRPIDPLFVVLASYAVSSFWPANRQSDSRKLEAEEVGAAGR